MLTKNYYMYPAVLDYQEDGDVQLIFPDFEEEMGKHDVFIGRWATDDDKIYETAVSYLFELIYNRLSGNDDEDCCEDDILPKPTPIMRIRLKEGQKSILVVVPQLSYGCDGLHLYMDGDDSRLRFGPKAWWAKEEKDDNTWIADEMEDLLRRVRASIEKSKASTEDE